MALPFEQAFELFKTTHPGVQHFQHERMPGGFPPGDVHVKSLELVTFHEFRLGTNVRRIGGWTFIAENSFVSGYIERLAKLWLWHQRTPSVANPPLILALRHCFKRFFAEISLGEFNNQKARALLVECVAFERDVLKAVVEGLANEPQAQKVTSDLASLAGTITRYHEYGHYALEELELTPEQMAQVVDQGHHQELLDTLATAHGSEEFIEEVFCDLFAFEAAIHPEFGPLSDHTLGDRLRMALFASISVSMLALLSFDARASARMEWFVETPDPPADEIFREAGDAIRQRMWLVEAFADRIAALSSTRLRDEQGMFPILIEPAVTFLEAYMSWSDLGHCDGASTCSAEEREIAEFVALGMSPELELSNYLLHCSRKFFADANPRLRTSRLFMTDPAGTSPQAP